VRRLTVLLIALLTVLAAAPAAAADRESFAYLGENGEFGWELVVAGPNGSQKVRVAPDAVGRPAIAPNGSQIAYAAPLGDGTLGRFAIFVSNLDGSGRTRITAPRLGDRDPAWSPDGRWIAFSRNLNDDLNDSRCCAIRLVRSNGADVTGVPGSRGGRNPAWSPDGTRLAYETPAGIFVSNLDGSQRVQLAGASGAEPAWSPDGSQIAYTREHGDASELVVRPAVGGDFRVRVSSTRYRIESPVWDNDGSTIHFVRYRGDGYLGRTAVTVRSHTPGVGQRLVFDPGNDIAHLSRVQRPSGGCDFDGDGFDDLAIGVPGDNTDKNNSGSVVVLHGTDASLTGADAQIWHRAKPTVKGAARRNAVLGAAVVCGDFDGDGYSDLAAGAPGDEAGRGSVMVLYGSSNGLRGAGDQRWEQDSPGIPSTAREGDRFGAALTTGDFDADGFDDLAIGAPGEGAERGAVHVLFGGPKGLTAAGDQYLQQGSGDVDGSRRPGEQFGYALAAADFDGDGRDDLAIGTPGETLPGRRDAGSVLVVHGSASGLWHQDVSGVVGSAEDGDRFGEALAAGDFDGDGFADLAVGVPGEDFGAVVDAGSTQILSGSSDGISANGGTRLFQGADGVAGVAEDSDRFGGALTAGDFDADGFLDLAVGSAGEDRGRGLVGVLYGSGNGVDGSRDQLWSKSTRGVLGSAVADDAFGAALTAGDYDGDGFLDLSIGTPGETRNGQKGSGAVHVLYGSGDRLTSVGDQVWHQNSAGVPGGPRAGDAFGSSLD
jgi:hypothetical protein